MKDAADLVHFKELHFLPRVIFSIGVICFIGSFFLKLFILGFFGVAVIFVGCTLNFLINTWRSFDPSPAKWYEFLDWTAFLQFLLSLVIAWVLLYLAYYYNHYGHMPPFLEPQPAKVRIDFRFE